ncbi:MAG: hypothetical protein JXR83_11220 [Deltaproteobacteria bacterium]|nr:hypothetical protein [Deltaproteobacteria bacterium]
MRRIALCLCCSLLALWSLGCDPCSTLADRICQCEDTEYLRQVCSQRVELQKQQRQPTDADKKACEAALKTCTCEALERQDLAACGFAR